MTDFAEGVKTEEIKKRIKKLKETKAVKELNALRKELKIRDDRIWRTHF